jgi:4-hydroxymandelate oxidase
VSDALPRDTVEAYYETGSGDEVTLRENEAAWRALRFRPRVLRDVTEVDLTTRLLGLELPSPVVVAPAALQGLAHPDGERATAAAAARAGTLLGLSTRSSEPLSEVAAALDGAPWWFQVYAMRNHELTIDLAQRAARFGATALVLTGDTPVVARKHRATPGLDLLGRYLGRLGEETGRTLRAEDVAQDPGADLALIRTLHEATGLPVLVKGVLRADEAETVLAAGAAGVVVSNHGGRQLDRAVASAYALPEVVSAVAGGAPVLVDGGIRSGLDALAALALGADAVLVGRPVLRGLMADGEAGVHAVLSTLLDELREALRLVGATSPRDLTPDLVV